MFPTSVAAWRTEPRIGAPPVGTCASYDLAHPIARWIAALSALVEQEPALSNGAQLTRLGRSGFEPGVLALSRIDAVARRG